MDSQTSVQALNAIISPHPTTLNLAGTCVDGKSSTENYNAIDDAEISIFDAEKYFSNDDDMTKRQVEKLPSHHDQDHRLVLSNSQRSHGRSLTAKSLSASSQASSNNTQTALLATFSPHRHRTGKIRWSSLAKKWLSRRNYCCCGSGKSVRVNQVIISNADERGPIVLMDTVNSGGDQSHKHITSESLSFSRFSITDDGIHHVRDIEAPRQQRISARGRPFINGFTFPIISDRVREDDVCSDASSDLFEIDSFATQTTLRNSVVVVDQDSNGGTPNDIDGFHRALRPLREAAEVKFVADEGAPPVTALHVAGGKLLPARRGSSQSSPVAAAG